MNNRYQTLQAFFLPPGSPERLGLARIIFYVCLFYLCYRYTTVGYAKAPHALWTDFLFYQLLPPERPSAETLIMLERIWKISLLTSAAGLLTQLSLIVSFLLSWYLFGFHMGYVPSDFHFQLPLLTMGVFMFAKSGASFSVDNFVRTKLRGKNRTEFLPKDFGWPFHLILFLLSSMYFKAGVSKLRRTGFDWVLPDIFGGNLAYARAGYRHFLPQVSEDIYQFLFEHSGVMFLVAVFILAAELLSLVPFFVPRTIKYFVMIWIGFHLGIYLMMGIWASVWLVPVYLMLVPWDKLARKGNGH